MRYCLWWMSEDRCPACAIVKHPKRLYWRELYTKARPVASLLASFANYMRGNSLQRMRSYLMSGKPSDLSGLSCLVHLLQLPTRAPTGRYVGIPSTLWRLRQITKFLQPMTARSTDMLDYEDTDRFLWRSNILSTACGVSHFVGSAIHSIRIWGAGSRVTPAFLPPCLPCSRAGILPVTKSVLGV